MSNQPPKSLKSEIQNRKTSQIMQQVDKARAGTGPLNQTGPLEARRASAPQPTVSQRAPVASTPEQSEGMSGQTRILLILNVVALLIIVVLGIMLITT